MNPFDKIQLLFIVGVYLSGLVCGAFSVVAAYWLRKKDDDWSESWNQHVERMRELQRKAKEDK